MALSDENKPQLKGIRVLVPAPGAYAVKGFRAFPPGTLASADRLRILTVGSTCEEVPATVLAAASWTDGSVKLAEIAFAFEAGRDGPAYFWVECGPQVTRAKPGQAAIQSPAQTLYFEEAEVPSPDFDLGAGTMLVRVERHPDLWYYAYFVPTAAILGLLIWRKVRLGR